MRHRSYVVQTILTAAAVALCSAAHGAVSGGLVSCELRADHMVVVLRADHYVVSEGSRGQRIVMEGFGDLAVSGCPRLPLKRFLIALPPGARALSVEVIRAETSELAGRCAIEPFPHPMPLSDTPRFDEALLAMQADWQTSRDAAYASDAAYPSQPAWLASNGTLREYAYAAVAFCPFAYHAKSGRLEYHREVEVAIAFEEGDAVWADPGMLNMSPRNGLADRKAARLFSNYDSMADLYRLQRPGPAPMSGSYDYVIVTRADLVPAITASGFLTWKTAIGYSVRTVLVTDPEISGQPGSDLAERVRNFLRAYCAAWGIEYVLIVGDYATVPMRICYPNPAFHVYAPDDPGLIGPGTPTDYYYADLSYPDALSWDSDGDGYHGEYGDDDPDFLAEVAVGRIPVNDSTRITHTLDKIAAFEQDTGTWKSNVLHGAAILFFENQNYSGYPFVDGATCLDSIEAGLMSGCSITHFSERTGLVTSPFPWPALREATFTSAWGSGQYGIVNWSGHGMPDGVYRTTWDWDDGDGVPESGNGEMRSRRFNGIGAANLNDDYPSIVFAVSCNIGYPDPNPHGNVGIDLLTLPGWGPSAGIVSSSRTASISAAWKEYGGGSEQIGYDFNRCMITEGERVGDALYDGKFYATTNYGWNHFYEYMNLYNFNLYGDPALDVDGATAGVSRGDRPTATAGISLGAARPNPFWSTTSFCFSITAAGPVRIRVYDAAGQVVTVLADSEYQPGQHAVTWDGRGAYGKALSPGLYFVEARCGDHRASLKTLLLR